jgi:hypothetical protein
VYLGKQRNLASTDVPHTYGIILEVVQKHKGVGHTIFMDNYFSSQKHLNDMHQIKINTCGTVHHNSKEMPYTFNPKYLQLKKKTMHPKYKETQGLCVGRTNKKHRSFLICTLHLQRKTSRKMGNL